ncbi:F-box only protein 22-like isoform X1 [Limulus polyphemus]|uniref:F-box only protein 22-like isoform X1 n=1 Tax=Limulus polyphemus TaxID=6850 RepID=A0ABM1T325_LIMPO|nr:F-box only protein 22-like isoform X1 [Limulus polyphemus]
MEHKQLGDDEAISNGRKLFSESKAKCSIEESIGQVLTTNYIIVERILNGLSISDLNTCALVCKLWNIVSQTIKKKRHDIFWMFQVAEYSDGDDDIFIDAHINSTDDKQNYVCSRNVGVGAHFYKILHEAPAEPKFGLLFCNDRFFFKPHQYFLAFDVFNNLHHRKNKRIRTENVQMNHSGRMQYNTPVMNFLAKSFPRSCYLFACAVPGIVGTPVDWLAPIEAEEYPGFSGVFLPDIPGVNVYPFTVTEHNQFLASLNKRSKHKVQKMEISQVTGIPNDAEVKCLLLFFMEVLEQDCPIQTLVEHYLVKQEKNIALGGAIVHELGFPFRVGNESRAIGGGVAFSGENVQAASVIIEKHVKTIKELEIKLKKLKECNIPGKKCLGFMFACCGRGALFYQKSNVEATAFHKVFPNVPLFGVFGNGELGINYLPKQTKEKTKVNSTIKGISGRTWLHAYTTVFVLLSFEN